ncbi:MAG: hypothetical protein E7180_06555 [Erysipelotrichaceae bacterium]|nr:hypothetical protein [Erysipelotrichaceae bacterium]
MKKGISLLVLSLMLGLSGCKVNSDNSSLNTSTTSEESTSESISSVLSSEELTSEITSELSSVTTSSEETSNIISNITSEIISNVTSEQNSQTSIEDTTSEEESSDVSTSENQTTLETPVTSENSSSEESSEEESSEEITSNTPTTSEEVSSGTTSESTSEEVSSETTSEEESSEIISSEEISSIVSESISSEVSSIVTSESISQATSDITTSIIESIESSDIVTSEEESSEEESSEEVTSNETTSENSSSEESSEEESSEEITSNTPTTSEEVSSETTSESTSEEVSSETTSEEESSEESSTPEEIVYDEPLDSVEGVDVTDLSALKEAFDNWGINYKKHSKTYFNDLALEIVNEIYNTYYIQDKITLCHENYRYVYNEEDSVNEAYFNLPGYLDLFKVPLYGDTLEERFESVINSSGIESSQLIDNISNYFIGGEDFSSEYVDTYGPKDVAQSGGTTKHYDGWTRISENKYKCDRLEVINDILKVVAPDFTNGGTYMTFRYVTIELNPMDGTDMRIRLYASPTQSGKMLDHHLDQENKPNWYLLFAEALISNIGETSIPAIENLLASQQTSE